MWIIQSTSRVVVIFKKLTYCLVHSKFLLNDGVKKLVFILVIVAAAI